MSYVDLSKIIDVTSRSIRDVFSLAKLNTIVITKANPLYPNKEFDIFSDTSLVANAYGLGSPVNKFSDDYFAVISKDATKADYLVVYNWAENGQKATIKGGAVENSIFSLDGKFKIDINDTAEEFEVDLTGSLSFSEVAVKLQTEIRTSLNPFLETATVVYSPSSKGFLFSVGLLEDVEVKFLQADTNDIHDKLGFTEKEGATSISWLPAKTWEEALNTIKTANGNYYLITTDFKLSNNFNTEKEMMLSLANISRGSNKRYATCYFWFNKSLFNVGSGASDFLKGYDGFIGVTATKEGYSTASICGLISALNLSNFQGNYNIAFNSQSVYDSYAINKDENYLGLKDNKFNAPVRFGILGQDDTILMDGICFGDFTDSINVYVGDSYLKFAQQIALYNMFKNEKMVALRGNAGTGKIKLYLDEVFNSARDAGIITREAELTTAEKSTLLSNFKDGQKAVEELVNEGYYYEVSRVDTVTKTMYITESYMATVGVRKIEINSYVLGA